MAPLSSPLAYPLTSSPPAITQKKRKRAPPSPIPRKRENTGPFIIEEDDDQDENVATIETPEFSLLGCDSRAHGTTGIHNHKNTIPASHAQTSKHHSPSDPALWCVHESTITGQQASLHLSTAIHQIRATDTSKTRRIRTSSGRSFPIHRRVADASIPIERLVAARSSNAPGRAKKSYYGIEIHQLLDEVAKESESTAQKGQRQELDALLVSVEEPAGARKANTTSQSSMWTEKYRAKKFTDLVGDERTHRAVLRWLKGWDPIVFPGSSKSKPKSMGQETTTEEMPHRKIMLLTGPPGFGKTTLAHVCARQAGYEILELNASDERSRDVVKGRIRDSVGTENVKGVNVKTVEGIVRKAGRPVCVVVDEVDGAVSGSGANGEGGFIKALLDLVAIDQKNTGAFETGNTSSLATKRKRNGDTFRLLRPLILICNDIYHPALRPLRSSKVAEIIHIRPPTLDKVFNRLKTIFDLENVPCDGDGVRRLCEATWGVSSRKGLRAEAYGEGEGDMRGVMVVGEWVARKLRALAPVPRLTRRWVEQHLLESLSHGGGGTRGVGRGGAKDIVNRVFQDGAGFPRTVAIGTAGNFTAAAKIGVTEHGKREAMDRLRELVDTSGESDRIVTDCFSTYPTRTFQDDTILSKPNAAYDWLHFYDTVSSKVFTSQDWELTPYLSQSVLGLHQLFASSMRQPEQQKMADDEQEEPLAFSGPRADFSAFEAEKHNRSILLGLQSSLNIPLLRSFRSLDDIATDLLPRLMAMLTPDIKPVIVGGGGEQRGVASVRRESERELVRRAVRVMTGVGVVFERARVETNRIAYGGSVYRMEPLVFHTAQYPTKRTNSYNSRPLDTLATFETATATSGSAPSPVRYSVRQVLDQEYQKYLLQRSADARQARYMVGNSDIQSSHLQDIDKENETRGRGLEKPKVAGAKRDFFGRIINESRTNVLDGNKDGEETAKKARLISGPDPEVNNVWVTFHEGFSNAVRKPITLEELMRGI